MQIGIPSTQENPSKDGMEPLRLPRCPLCSGALVPLHNAYRCSRCAYHLCIGCEQIETSSTADE
jgi:hypothetical protein